MTCKCDEGAMSNMSTNQSNCAGQQMPVCPPTLVSPKTAADQRAAKRTAMVPINVGALAAGASTGSTVLMASNGSPLVLVLEDLVTSLLNRDMISVEVFVNGVSRLDFFGGRFDRSNNSPCTNACGMAVCAGPVESINVIITNRTAAAFVAGDTVTLSTRVVYSGEPGFKEVCGACVEPGAVPGGPAPGAAFNVMEVG